MVNYRFACCISGVTLLVLIGIAWATENVNTATRSGNYEIERQVISSSGTNGNSADFMLSGSAGHSVAGQGGSQSYSLTGGIWQIPQSGSCTCRPGDPNNDTTTNIGDAVYLITYVFKGGPAPSPYATCSGDPNADCAVNIGDAVHIINFIFKGGPPPVTCQEWLSNCGSPLRK